MANYVTVQELRDEGLPASVGDIRAGTLITRAEALVEELTRNFFREVSGTFVFDGNNAHILHLPLPIISVTSLTINGHTAALDSNFYQVFNGRQRPNDDRRNPKIKLKASAAATSIYAFGATDRFLKGLDQTIVGKFGFLEPNDSVPEIVKECVIGIALLQAETLYDRLDGMEGVMGPKIKERTDDHEVQWGNVSKQPGRFVVPKYIHDRLMLYRAPRTVKVPEVRWSKILD